MLNRTTGPILASLLFAAAACGDGGTQAQPGPEPRLREVELVADASAAGVSAATDGVGFMVSYLDGPGLAVLLDSKGAPLSTGPLVLTGPPACEPLPDYLPELTYEHPGLPMAEHAGEHYWASWLAHATPRGQAGGTVARVRKITPDGAAFPCADTLAGGQRLGYCGPQGLTWEVSPTVFENRLAAIVYHGYGCVDGSSSFTGMSLHRVGLPDSPRLRWPPDALFSVSTNPPLAGAPAPAEVAAAEHSMIVVQAWVNVLRGLLPAHRPPRSIVIHSTPFETIGSDDSPEIAVAATSSQYLVTWLDSVGAPSRLLASRVTLDGEVLDPEGVVLVNERTQKSHLVIAANDDRYLISWTEASGSGTRDARAVIVNTEAALDEPEPITLAKNVLGPISATGNARQFLVAFQRATARLGDLPRASIHAALLRNER